MKANAIVHEVLDKAAQGQLEKVVRMGDIRSGGLAPPFGCGISELPPSAFDVTAFHLALRHANRPLCPKVIDKFTVLERQLWDQVFQKEVRSHFQVNGERGQRHHTVDNLSNIDRVIRYGTICWNHKNELIECEPIGRLLSAFPAAESYAQRPQAMASKINVRFWTVESYIAIYKLIKPHWEGRDYL